MKVEIGFRKTQGKRDIFRQCRVEVDLADAGQKLPKRLVLLL